MLSIVRLRSEPFTNRELAYFFIALVLALVCAIDLGSPGTAALLAAIALAGAWVVDHPRLSRPTRRVELVLELVFADDDALHRHLEERLDADGRRRRRCRRSTTCARPRARACATCRAAPAPRDADAPVLAG